LNRLTAIGRAGACELNAGGAGRFLDFACNGGGSFAELAGDVLAASMASKTRRACSQWSCQGHWRGCRDCHRALGGFLDMAIYVVCLQVEAVNTPVEVSSSFKLICVAFCDFTERGGW
jgi:hypothetical protein